MQMLHLSMWLHLYIRKSKEEKLSIKHLQHWSDLYGKMVMKENTKLFLTPFKGNLYLIVLSSSVAGSVKAFCDIQTFL